MLGEVRANPNNSGLSVLSQAGQPIDNIKANIKLVFSLGQNEPRDAITGRVAAVLIHALVHKQLHQSGEWGQAFKEYTSLNVSSRYETLTNRH